MFVVCWRPPELVTASPVSRLCLGRASPRIRPLMFTEPGPASSHYQLNYNLEAGHWARTRLCQAPGRDLSPLIMVMNSWLYQILKLPWAFYCHHLGLGVLSIPKSQVPSPKSQVPSPSPSRLTIFWKRDKHQGLWLSSGMVTTSCPHCHSTPYLKHYVTNLLWLTCGPHTHVAFYY